MESLNLDPLSNALKQLEDGLAEARLYPGDELRRDGVIQRFEYSMDLSWKLIQRYLKLNGMVGEANVWSKKDLFREAARLKLIASAEVWIGYYNARNETSHMYDRLKAQAVFEQASLFLADGKALLENLRHAH